MVAVRYVWIVCALGWAGCSAGKLYGAALVFAIWGGVCAVVHLIIVKRQSG